MALPVPVQDDESSSLQVLGVSSLALSFQSFQSGCETWTVTRDLRRTLDSFGTRCLRRILGYRWSDFVSNEQFLRETQMRFVTCVVRERQLRLHGHVAPFLILILLTRFSQRGSLVSGGGQWADHVPRGCSRLISISRRLGWARHLPGGWPDGGPWSTSYHPQF